MTKTAVKSKTTKKQLKDTIKDIKTTAKVVKETTKKVKVHFSKEKAHTEELVNNLAKTKITKKIITENVPDEVKEVIDFAAKLQAMKKELTAYEDQLKDATKALMKKYDLNTLVSLLAKAQYTEYTSETFDKKLFQQEHPKIYKQYIGTQTKERFSIDLAK